MRGSPHSRRPRRNGRPALAVLAGTAGLLLVGCGEDRRQDAGQEEAEYRLEVADVSFPARQSVAGPERLQLTVRNAESDRSVPNVAVTLKTTGRGGGQSAFGQAGSDATQAEATRPVWILDQGPSNGSVAYSDTWALGRLAAGASRTFTWEVTPVRAGAYRLRFEVVPGLTGRARVSASGDARTSGTLAVTVSGDVPLSTVGPDGEVRREPREAERQ